MFKRTEPKEVKQETLPVFPHCAPRILHAPGECIYCDTQKDWQYLRKVWGHSIYGLYSRRRRASMSRRLCAKEIRINCGTET